MVANNAGRQRRTESTATTGFWAGLAVAASLVLAPAQVRADAIWFDIAAQPLPAALKMFAAQAKIQLLYEHSAVASVRGNAVTGELDKHEALSRLLQNTGLEVIYSSDRAATIRPIATAIPPQPTTAVREPAMDACVWFNPHVGESLLGMLV